MKSRLRFGLFLAALLTVALGPLPEARAKPVELIGTAGIGGAPFRAIPTRWPAESQPLTFYGALRLRIPKYTPLAIEANTVFAGAFGLGFNLLIDVWRTKRVRLHLGDPGIFFSLANQITAGNWDRDFDLTVGGGIEIKPSLKAKYRHYRITVDFRWFLPNPFEIESRLGNYALPLYEDAAKGVQIWIGIGRTFF